VGSWKIIATSLPMSLLRSPCDSEQVVAGEAELVGLDAAGVGHQAHQGHHGDALAGAGFADDAEDFAFFEGQADAVNGMHDAVLRGELDGEVFYF
jgi:hypothetical protein